MTISGLLRVALVVATAAVLIKPGFYMSPASAEKPDIRASEFADEPAAHRLYDQMFEVMRKAKSLSFTCQYERESVGVATTACTYRLWLKKPNFFRMESQSLSGEAGGVLIGDGETLWIYWPNGRPRWPNVDVSDADEKTRFTSYISKPAPQGKHSILHEAVFLGGGMSLPILDASTFHGYVDSLQNQPDGVRSLGSETIGDEECDKIEVSFLDHQRSLYLWLSKRDHLPRKLKEIARLSNDNIAHEHWSSVKIGEEIPDSMFRWAPPTDWQQWTLPDYRDDLLKPGTKAPDFDMASVDGKRIRLSDYEGKVVWLCFWRLGCPPCRVETPYLQELYSKHKDEGFVVLAVNVEDDGEITLRYLEEQGVTFPNVLDTSEGGRNVCYQDYGGGGVPLNYLIDRDGIVVDGGFEHTDPRVTTALRKLGVDAAEPAR